MLSQGSAAALAEAGTEGALPAGAAHSVLRFPGVRRVGGEESEPGNIWGGRRVPDFLGRCNETGGREMGAGCASVCSKKH